MTPEEEAQLEQYVRNERVNAAWLTAVLILLCGVMTMWAAGRVEWVRIAALFIGAATIPVLGFKLWVWFDLRRQKKRS